MFTSSTPTPLLDPIAGVTIQQVGFGHLLPGRGEQMVFSQISNYGGSGSPGELVVVDFNRGIANKAYEWAGDGGVRSFKIVGDRITTRAEFWTAVDAHCCHLERHVAHLSRLRLPQEGECRDAQLDSRWNDMERMGCGRGRYPSRRAPWDRPSRCGSDGIRRPGLSCDAMEKNRQMKRRQRPSQ